LETSGSTNRNRATLTTPKHSKYQKGIFFFVCRTNPSHMKEPLQIS